VNKIQAVPLTNAIVRMTVRYGEAERQGAHAFSRTLGTIDDGTREAAMVEYVRFDRAAVRRLRAVRRLVAALAGQR
jgi:hypothetical protein